MSVLVNRFVERSSDRCRLPRRAALPAIDRQDISWRGGLVDAPLELQLRFHNPTRRFAPATDARIEVAAFGAFVPWHPLARVPVPALPPNGRRLVTATAGGDEARPTGLLALTEGMLERTVGRPVHFVGNLNVYVTRGSPVERHVQRSIGVRAGHDNLAVFLVGDGRPDHYSFSPGIHDTGWEIELPCHEWHVPVALRSAVVPVVIRPRSGADSGKVAILVTRHSTGQQVPVEFDLEAAPSNGKCYFV